MIIQPAARHLAFCTLLVTSAGLHGQVTIGGVNVGANYTVNSSTATSSLSIVPPADTVAKLRVTNSATLTVSAGAPTVLIGGPGAAAVDIIASSTLKTSGTVGVVAANSLNSNGQLTVRQTSKLLVGGTLTVGNNGNGSFIAQEASTLVTGQSLLVGWGSGGVGDLTIAGSGTTATIAGTFMTGGLGRGNSGVIAGAKVEVGGYLTVGHYANSTGTLAVNGPGSSVRNAGGGYGFQIGYEGNGQAYVRDGARIDSDGFVVVGNRGTSTGYLEIYGTDSVVSAKQNFSVGSYGTGGVLVTDGGLLLANGGLFLGEESTAVYASLTINGAGSSAIVTDFASIGIQSTGLVNVQNGAILLLKSSGSTGLPAELRVGDGATGSGQLNIDRAGSRLDAETRVVVGNSGQGTLNVTAGGTLNITGTDDDGSSLILGREDGSSGFVKVSGPGSQVSLSGQAVIGERGQGNLSVTDRAAFRVKGEYLLIGNEDAVGQVSVKNATLISDKILALGTTNAAQASSSLLASDEALVKTNTAFIGTIGGEHNATITKGATLEASDAIFVGGDPSRDYGYGLWSGGKGNLSITEGGIVTTKKFELTNGQVTLWGSTLNADSLLVDRKGSLILSGGTINSAEVENRGFVMVWSAPGDLTTIRGTFDNRGNTIVTLQEQSRITFENDVTNRGMMVISSKGAGTAQFNGTFTNAQGATFIQDPTITRFATLLNDGTFTAGLGDTVLVDGLLKNTGFFNLTGSFLSAGLGIENAGTFCIFGGATIDGAFSGLGNLVFHVSSASDLLTLDDSFTGRLEIVFDDNYNPLGTENIIFFGKGANLTDLIIGGVDLDVSLFAGSGFLSSRGLFTAAAPVPEPATYALWGVFVVTAMVLRRRLRF